MNVTYLRPDGSEVNVGDTIKLNTGETVVMRNRYSEFELYVRNSRSSGFYLPLRDTDLKAVKWADTWPMNRRTGKLVEVGDVLANGHTVTSVSLINTAVYTDRDALLYDTSAAGKLADAGLEFHNRASYGESPPAMPEHRMRCGVLYLKHDGARVKSSELFHSRSFGRWNTNTHMHVNARIIALADTAVLADGTRVPADEAVTVIRRASGKCETHHKHNCVDVHDDGVFHLKDDLFWLADSEEWTLELDDSCEWKKLLHAPENHRADVDNCVYCAPQRGYALSEECEEWDGDYYTISWLEDNTFTCDSCGERFHNDSYGDDGMCSGCYDDGDSDSRVRDYGSRAANDFTPEKNVPIKFGIELEVEPSGDQNRSLDVFDALLPSRYAVYKEDGSLSCYGFEIVTRPDCPSVHKRIWLDVLADKSVRQTTTSWKSGSCGIHIHVSRAPLSDLWVGRIVVLIHSARMAGIVSKVAGRYNKSYCEVDHRKKLTAGKGTNCSRYAAVNTCHTKTIEFRIFRGTLHRESFIKNIEFVEAVLAYCRPAVASNALVDDPDCFLQYVANNRKSYKHLYEFLVDKKFYGDTVLLKPTPEVIAQRKALSIEKRKLKQLA